ncbi:MAG: hydroxylamine reductase, partial [Coriobacteriia bacterium]
MFCNQCEQASGGTGCTTVGVCGKTPEVAALQDLLLHQLKGVAAIAVVGAKVGVVDQAADEYVMGSLF